MSKMGRYLERLGKRLASAREVDVGFLEGATYPDGTPVAMVAAIQNFGAPAAGIPPRAFFSNMVAEKGPQWPDEMRKVLKANDMDGTKALNLMGMRIGAQIQQSIIDTNSPPLSPVTLMLKKMRSDDPDLVVTGKTVGEAARRVQEGEDYSGQSTKPLIDTAHMLNSVQYQVDGVAHDLPKKAGE